MDAAIVGQPERGNILGVRVSCLDLPRAAALVNEWVARKTSAYVTVTPAHVVMDAQRDSQLRRILNAAGMATPDGMAIVWLLRLQGHRDVARVYGPDLMLSVCRAGVASGHRHFLYGGEPGVVEALAAKLTEQTPGLQIVGTYSPPFRDLTLDEDRAAVERIQSAKPDIVWIGLGSPRQEYWMADHVGRLGGLVLIGVGAAFDFLSGRKPQAPRWMQRSGLEWLFRLVSEPRRLWPRYRQYPRFVWLSGMQLLGLHKYPEEQESLQ